MYKLQEYLALAPPGLTKPRHNYILRLHTFIVKYMRLHINTKIVY